MDWPNCRNVRDLAGITVRGAHRIRTRALIRSDNLDQLSEHGLAALRAADVTRVVDLRSAWECRTFPSPPAEDPAWLNVPLTDPADPDQSELDLAQQYCLLLDRKQPAIGAAVAAIADAPPGAVLVNCHAGKDRTGVIVAVVLASLGASDEAIGADYATSPAHPQPADAHPEPHPSTTQLPELMPPRPATIITALTHLRAHHGNITAYLTRAGLTAHQLHNLSNRLCAPTSDQRLAAPRQGREELRE